MAEAALDLSRLPPPDVVDPIDYEALLAAATADLKARWPGFTAAVESDPAYKVLGTFAYHGMLLRQRINDASRRVMPAYAAGADLEHMAALYGVGRQSGEGDERLRRRMIGALAGASTAGPAAAYRSLALAASPLIADAHAASPEPGQVTVTVLPTEAADAARRLPSPITLGALPKLKGEAARIRGAAVREQSSWNLIPEKGGDAHLTDSLAITKVTWRGARNIGSLSLSVADAAWFGADGRGADKEVYVVRGGYGGIASWGARETIGRYLVNYAVSAADGGRTVLDGAGGETVLVIVADQGAVTAEQRRPLPLRAEDLSGDDVRPIGDRVRVEAADVRTYALRAKVTVAPGPDAELVRAAAEAAAREYTAGAYALGRDIGIDAIHAALHVSGVDRAAVSSPAADIVVGDTGAARSASLEVGLA